MAEGNSQRKMYVKTPLHRSNKLSENVGATVWLKMETAQVSGSFKARGLSNFAQKAVSMRGCTKFSSFSGGNAGLAAAYAARELGLPITVMIPNTTPPHISKKLEMEKAQVEIKPTFDDARKAAEKLAEEPGCELIHPFDHTDIWEGHASIVEEIHEQLHGLTPDLVVLSVGGGGLMNGVLEGMHQVGWTEVPLLALETQGAHSLNACIQAGEWVELEKIESIAICLGIKKVCKKSFEWLSKHQVLSEVVTDKEAVSACLQMADDHLVLVPPACGAALAALYTPSVWERVVPKLPHRPKNIVVIVCGGSGVSLDIIQKWKKTFDL